MAIFEVHLHGDYADIKSELLRINKKLNLMPTKAEFQAVIDRQNTALTNIAEDIRRIKDQLANGGLTDAEEQELVDQLTAAADRAEALAGENPEPTEPAPTPEA